MLSLHRKQVKNQRPRSGLQNNLKLRTSCGFFMDIEFIRKNCTTLKAVTEDIKWGNDLVFSVGGKMFCVVGLEPPFGCSFKVPDEEFEEISGRPGFMPAPYMARAKWVKVNSAETLNSGEWKRSIQRSYELVKAKLTKKQKLELGLN